MTMRWEDMAGMQAEPNPNPVITYGPVHATGEGKVETFCGIGMTFHHGGWPDFPPGTWTTSAENLREGKVPGPCFPCPVCMAAVRFQMVVAR